MCAKSYQIMGIRAVAGTDLCIGVLNIADSYDIAWAPIAHTICRRHHSELLILGH